MMRKEEMIASEIVDKIIANLNDRRGLGLDDLDADIQDEIRHAWIDIVLETL